MVRILSRSDVRRCINMTEAIAAMRTAFTMLQTAQAQMPPRQAVALQEQGITLIMPSLIQTNEQQVFAIKLISVIPNNPIRHLPRSYATIMLLDAVTGRTLALLEGGWLTAVRTGAISGLATDLLARKDARILTVFGAGVQAPMQVVAIHTVRPLDEVRVVNRNDEHYQALVAVVQEMLGEACPPVIRAHTTREALAGASMVACATAATTPLFSWQDVAPGTHINAIGAFTPEMCEVDEETVSHARIVVDQREAAMAEAGDLLQPLARGLIGGAETWIELGELLAGKQPGRNSADEVTFFKSVGVGVQDVAAALHVYNRARELNIGVEIDV
jgi:ornithine cyclodeaminase/alanine dehydrogenase-like protein (mu-crystallin family)